jgi:hypothetical protein
MVIKFYYIAYPRSETSPFTLILLQSLKIINYKQQRTKIYTINCKNNNIKGNIPYLGQDL